MDELNWGGAGRGGRWGGRLFLGAHPVTTLLASFSQSDSHSDCREITPRPRQASQLHVQAPYKLIA